MRRKSAERQLVSVIVLTAAPCAFCGSIYTLLAEAKNMAIFVGMGESNSSCGTGIQILALAARLGDAQDNNLEIMLYLSVT